MGNGASAGIAAAAAATSEKDLERTLKSLPPNAWTKLVAALDHCEPKAATPQSHLQPLAPASPTARSTRPIDNDDERKNSVYWRERGQYHVLLDRTVPEIVEAALNEAARVISEADALLFVTGAGMGVDMGLSDFRSSTAFWSALAHPEIKRYEDASDSAWFDKDPALAWGLNYHQLDSYRKAEPHEGYKVLHQLAKRKGADRHFCWTSNVDGVFQRAGFSYNRVREVHGNIHRLQCTRGRRCKTADGKATDPWEDEVRLDLTEAYRCSDALPLPTCHRCGSLARPNLWFCTDHGNYMPWSKLIEVGEAYPAWLDRMEEQKKSVVVIECGAGLVIPSARLEAEEVAERFGTTLVRINPTDYMAPTADPKGIGLPMGSAAALRQIWRRVEKLSKSPT